MFVWSSFLIAHLGLRMVVCSLVWINHWSGLGCLLLDLGTLRHRFGCSLLALLGLGPMRLTKILGLGLIGSRLGYLLLALLGLGTTKLITRLGLGLVVWLFDVRSSVLLLLLLIFSHALIIFLADLNLKKNEETHTFIGKYNMYASSCFYSSRGSSPIFSIFLI